VVQERVGGRRQCSTGRRPQQMMKKVTDRRSGGGRRLSGQGGAVRRCEACRCRVGPGWWTERAIRDGAPVARKADGIGRLRTLLMAQRLYPRVQLRSTESLGRTKAVWWLKAAAHQGQRRRSGAERGNRPSASRAGMTMERGVTGVASPLLQSVEGIRVGDGGAHGTVGRSGPRATS
jgi:hypothetical protein